MKIFSVFWLFIVDSSLTTARESDILTFNHEENPIISHYLELLNAYLQESDILPFNTNTTIIDYLKSIQASSQDLTHSNHNDPQNTVDFPILKLNEAPSRSDILPTDNDCEDTLLTDDNCEDILLTVNNYKDTLITVNNCEDRLLRYPLNFSIQGSALVPDYIRIICSQIKENDIVRVNIDENDACIEPQPDRDFSKEYGGIKPLSTESCSQHMTYLAINRLHHKSKPLRKTLAQEKITKNRAIKKGREIRRKTIRRKFQPNANAWKKIKEQIHPFEVRSYVLELLQRVSLSFSLFRSNEPSLFNKLQFKDLIESFSDVEKILMPISDKNSIEFFSFMIQLFNKQLCQQSEVVGVQSLGFCKDNSFDNDQIAIFSIIRYLSRASFLAELYFDNFCKFKPDDVMQFRELVCCGKNCKIGILSEELLQYGSSSRKRHTCHFFRLWKSDSRVYVFERILFHQIFFQLPTHMLKSENVIEIRVDDAFTVKKSIIQAFWFLITANISPNNGGKFFTDRFLEDPDFMSSLIRVALSTGIYIHNRA